MVAFTRRKLAGLQSRPSKPQGELMRAILGPTSRMHPRAAATLLEGLALWQQQALSVVLYADVSADGCAVGLLDALGGGIRTLHYSAKHARASVFRPPSSAAQSQFEESMRPASYSTTQGCRATPRAVQAIASGRASTEAATQSLDAARHAADDIVQRLADGADVGRCIHRQNAHPKTGIERDRDLAGSAVQNRPVRRRSAVGRRIAGK